MDEIEFPKIDPGRVIVLEKKQATPLPTSEPTSGPVNKNLNSITSHTTPPQRSGSTQDSSQLTQQHQSQQSQAQGTTKSGNGLTQHHRASKTTSHTNSTAQQNTQAKPRPTPKSVILAPGQTRPPNTKVLLRDDQLAKVGRG
ncbi:hypothetical protein SARC_14072 [Sphaeroforma arctica JP610]|uniref:Uncharacterized protein n=1 Tax=Sphaeroforma arctica JP610 TaxID=667725 RepID=A0A0L0FB98_9EUKA|nr:hypothetical protein SARC_14072 [Sphaeroforma arctica JP610]KNC73368.1 hypothetical protein SARC_14072 [Sphaeroforma arctica JP610]|eukprot:XP_014147270.1 hypothetical protein SARC_14072 [Sphaeroforma arctica JP610]